MNSKTKTVDQYSFKTKSPLSLSQSNFFLDFNFDLNNTTTLSFLTTIRPTCSFYNVLALASKTIGHMREETMEIYILPYLLYAFLSFLVNSIFKLDLVNNNLLTL